MSRPQRMRLSDVRKVFRLVGEVRELGAEPATWQRHMLEALEGIFGAPVGMCAQGIFPAGKPVPVPGTFFAVGLPGIRNWRAHAEFVTSPEATRCPVFCAITHWRPACYTRNYSGGRMEPSFDAKTWNKSALQEHRRAAGLDGFLYSQHALPGVQAIHVITLERALGEQPFTRGQRRLLHLFHDELGRLWRLEQHDELAGLSPRLRQTLDALLVGQSEKQVARVLGISTHTVHNYVKDLHRRLHVNSRGELLAHCNSKAHDFAPHLLQM